MSVSSQTELSPALCRVFFWIFTMPAGRPTKYKKDYAEQARHLCQLGATDFEVAQALGVTTVTVWRWKAQYPEFCNALKAGKEYADERVKRSLYSKAVGYSYESEKLWQYDGKVIRATTTEHVPPSDTAAIIWLKNRDPENWRDKQEVAHSMTVKLESDANKL